MWKLRGGPLPGAVLVLMPDPVRLRHARRMLDGFPAPAFLAVESEAVQAAPDDPVWSPQAVNSAVGLRQVLDRLAPGGELPEEPEPQRASVPADLAVAGPGWSVPDYLLPATLRPAEKRAIDLVSDWPWIALKDLAGMLGVSHQRASQVVIPLEALKLVVRHPETGGRLALTDRALALLARRDRTSLSMAKGRWSAAPLFPGAPFDWTNVAGGRSRQLLRNLEHTAAVHSFLAAMTTQAALLQWEVVQMDPPRRASRYFRHGDRMRSVNPDAFGLLRKDGTQLALLPGVGAPRRAPVHHVGPPGPLPALLLLPPAHRRPRNQARRPHRLRRRHRPNPLPAPGKGGDAGHGRDGPPVGLPPGGRRGNGAAGPRLAHARTTRSRPWPCRPNNSTNSKEKPMPSRNNHQRKGTRRRGGRNVVRLDAAALWRRLELLDRSQNWLAREVGVSPAYVSMLVNGGRSPSGRIRRRMRKALGVTNSKELFKTEEKHERP